MDEIIRQIKNQTEINFINIKEQIEAADLEAIFDGVNGSRYIFHNLHSMDRFFINPLTYVYEGEKLFGISENLSVISTEREGYVADTSIVIPREKLWPILILSKIKLKNILMNLQQRHFFKNPRAASIHGSN